MEFRDSSMEELANSKLKGFVSWGSKEWANRELSYAIGVLQGKNIDSLPSGRLQIALYLRDLLAEHSYMWQVRCLEAWIHRFQRGDFTASREADSHERKERASS